MQVREFLEPMLELPDSATLAEALAALASQTPVFVSIDRVWHTLAPADVAGYPATRRLIDVPLRAVQPIAADAPASSLVEDESQPVSPVEDGGVLVGCVDRRNVLEALASSTDPSQVGVLLMTRLIPTLMHDLANSLLLANTSLDLAGQLNDPSELDTARSALRHVEDLLNRARFLASPDATDPTPVLELRAALEEARPLLDIAGRGLAISVVPGPAPGPRVRATRRLLERTLMNLVLNARDAMKAQGALRVSIDASGNRTDLVVEDDGPGVPEGLAAHIFDAGVTSKRGPGRGLGLAGVALALRRVGATIALGEGALGGACFRVSFLSA